MNLIEGTFVKTNRGNVRVEDLTLEDQILTSKGYCKINFIKQFDIRKNLKKIKSKMISSFLLLEPEQKIFIKKFNKGGKYKYLNLSKFEAIQLNDINSGWLGKSLIDNSNSEEYNNDISNDFARLLGYYLGDGNIQVFKRKDKIKSLSFRITYHRRDKKDIISDAIAIVKKEFPEVNHSIYKHKLSNTNIISFYSTKLSRKILYYCGGAKNKTASKIIFLNPEKQLEFLKGWYKTDGCMEWLNTSMIFSACRNLAEDFISIVQKCKVSYNITYCKPGISTIRNKEYKNKGGYRLFFHSPKPQDKSKNDSRNVFSRIYFEDFFYQGKTFNMSFEGEDIVANNILLANY